MPQRVRAMLQHRPKTHRPCLPSLCHAKSHFLHWFPDIASLDMISVPSKSTLERFDKILSSERMEAFNCALFAKCSGKNASQRAGLGAPVDFTDAYIDATCLKADIHF
jgi:hypothetical protein